MIIAPPEKSQLVFQPALYPKEPFLYLDPGSVGYFTLLVKRGEMISRSYPMRLLPEILRYADRDRDTWISQNQFFRRNRRLVNLFQINTAFADLDTYNGQFLRRIPPDSQALMTLEECQERKIPRPSVILFSGRGLQVKWIFSRPVPRQALPRWNAMQRCITRALKEMRADQNSIDGSRVLRLEQTVNSKSGERVRVLWPTKNNPATWDFEILANEILPLTRQEIDERRASRAARTNPTTGAVVRNPFFTRQSLNWARLEDIRKLAYMRGWSQGNPDGWRDPFIFCGAVFASWMSHGNGLFWETEALAKEFAPHWSQTKLLGKVSWYFRMVGEGRRYKYSNERLIDVLQITGNEEQELRTIISPGEARRRHREREEARRRAAGALEREQYEAQRLTEVEKRRKQALELREKGLTYREIANELGTTIRHVFRLTKG